MMPKNRTRLTGGVFALLAIAAPALDGRAQSYNGEQVSSWGQSSARRITMGVGKSIIIDLPQDAGEVFVGNPDVANAIVRSPRKIYIIGHGTGQTTIYAMDKQGRRFATLRNVDRPRHRRIAGHPPRRHADRADHRPHRQRLRSS